VRCLPPVAPVTWRGVGLPGLVAAEERCVRRQRVGRPVDDRGHLAAREGTQSRRLVTHEDAVASATGLFTEDVVAIHAGDTTRMPTLALTVLHA
jgi:hypothetical protein